MKRIVAILLLILYLFSFSGMVMGKDCQANALHFDSIEELNLLCNKYTGHSTNTAGHPLEQFCKVIEVHKEVLVAHSQQSFAHFPPVYIHRYQNRPESFVKVKSFNTSISQPPSRLFIKNRVLLI